MGDARFWAALTKYVPYWLGWVATTISGAFALGIVDSKAPAGRLCALVSFVLSAYGIHAAMAWSPPREPWSHEQKLAESQRRIAMHMPPLVGYEYLVTGRGGPGSGPDPTLPPPPLAPPPLPPADDTPPTKKGV